MKQSALSTNMAIFILFFGIAVFEAFRSKSVGLIIFWVVIAGLFVVLSRPKKKQSDR